MSAGCSRKEFLAFTLTAFGASLFGCSDDVPSSSPKTPTEGGGGTSSGSGGGTGTGGAKNSGSGGSSGSSNGSGGGKNGSGGSNSGSGGSSASSGGTGGGSSGSGGGDASGGSKSGGAECEGDQLTALCSGSPSDGHKHVLYIPVADIEAGETKTYQTERGNGVEGGSHCHQVELTADDFETLKSGGVVKKRSCNGGDHQFVISCAETDEEPEPPTDCSGDNSNAGACD